MGRDEPLDPSASSLSGVVGPRTRSWSDRGHAGDAIQQIVRTDSDAGVEYVEDGPFLPERGSADDPGSMTPFVPDETPGPLPPTPYDPPKTPFVELDVRDDEPIIESSSVAPGRLGCTYQDLRLGTVSAWDEYNQAGIDLYVIKFGPQVSSAFVPHNRVYFRADFWVREVLTFRTWGIFERTHSGFGCPADFAWRKIIYEDKWEGEPYFVGSREFFMDIYYYPGGAVLSNPYYAAKQKLAEVMLEEGFEYRLPSDADIRKPQYGDTPYGPADDSDVEEAPEAAPNPPATVIPLGVDEMPPKGSTEIGKGHHGPLKPGASGPKDPGPPPPPRPKRPRPQRRGPPSVPAHIKNGTRRPPPPPPRPPAPRGFGLSRIKRR